MRIRFFSAAGFMAVLIVASLIPGLFPNSNNAGVAQAQTQNPPCVDSTGTTTGFFCQPLTSKGKLIKACAERRPKSVGECRNTTVLNYCSSRGFDSVATYALDADENLTEVVCMRANPALAAATPDPTPVDEWQPMVNVNLMGYDHREFGLSRPDDWKTCKAACDSDGQCRAWTVSVERSMCYLKWDDNPELLSSNACCITAIKGMASAGEVAQQKKIRTPEELKRLGSRLQNAAEDEVGRRTEDKVRRALGKILGN